MRLSRNLGGGLLALWGLGLLAGSFALPGLAGGALSRPLVLVVGLGAVVGSGLVSTGYRTLGEGPAQDTLRTPALTTLLVGLALLFAGPTLFPTLADTDSGNAALVTTSLVVLGAGMLAVGAYAFRAGRSRPALAALALVTACGWAHVLGTGRITGGAPTAALVGLFLLVAGTPLALVRHWPPGGPPEQTEDPAPPGDTG